MSTDDDIAAALPKPPPSAPARREAAIGEALRRFDAGGEAPAAAGKEREKQKIRWWTPLGLSQAGVMVSAALVALIGLPVAWVSLTPPTRTGSENPPKNAIALTETRSPAAMTDAGASPSPPSARARPDSRIVPPGIVAADTAPAEAPPPPPVLASPPPPQVVALPTAPAAAPAAAPPMGAIARRAEPARDRQEEGTRDLVVSARAPAPAAAPYALRDVENESIVVTGSRVSRPKRIERGDWNACTVNDPRQRLGACKRLVDPAAKGTAGLAAARIADGLSQAWQGDLSDAIGAFDQAIATDPKSAFAHLNRGLAYANRGDLDRAIADLDQAVRYAPRAARGYYNRSVLLRQRGDIRRARADEARAIELDPYYREVVR